MSSPRISSTPTMPAPIPSTEVPASESTKPEVPPSGTTSTAQPSASTPAGASSQLAAEKLQAGVKAAELHAQVDKKEGSSQKSTLTAEQKKVDELIASGQKLSADKITDQLFYDRYPTLKGSSLAPGTQEADTWNQIKKEVVDPRMPAEVKAKSTAKSNGNKSTAQTDPFQQCDPAGETKVQADMRAAQLQGMLGKQSPPAQTNLTLEQKRADELINGSTKWDADKMTDQIFSERHPELKDTSITEASPEYNEWARIKSDVVEPRLKEAQDIRSGDVDTNWNLKLHTGANDIAKTDELFYEKYPDLKGKEIKTGSTEAQKWKEMHNEVQQNQYNDAISAGVKELPGLEPKVLKALLVSESNFETGVVNSRGFAGIAQFGRKAASTSGLVVDGKVDERLDPEKAIPAAARHLKDKSEKLETMAFPKYGTPQGDEYWKFVAGAYNGGEEAVTIAMKTAYNNALKEANAQGMDDQAASKYASDFATKWENLLEPKDNFAKSPLYAATSTIYKEFPEAKYHEIGGYSEKILTLARDGVLIKSGKPAFD